MGMFYTTPTFKPRRKSKKAVAVAPKAPKRPFVPMKPREVDVIAPRTDQYKSKIDDFLATSDPTPKQPHRYEGELAEREAIARERSEALKKCVAPAYNKGAYTLITSPEQAKWIGRK